MTRLAVVAIVVGSLSGALVPVIAGAQPNVEQLTVRTYDTFGVTTHDMTVAKNATAGILKGAGIDIRWRDCSGVGQRTTRSRLACDDPLGMREVIVRITHARSRTAANSLGDSMVDVQRETGAFATIYEDRVASMAALASFDAGTLLGRAMAHELGHLLLGSAVHSSSGLMRAYWNVEDLQHDVSRDWVVSAVEAADMRHHLMAKMHQEPDSPTVGSARARIRSGELVRASARQGLSAVGDRN